MSFKPNHRFIGLGVTEFFAGETCDGRRIVAERVNVRAQLLGDGILLLQFGVEPENLAAHPFVLLDGFLVGENDEDQNGQRHEDEDRLTELAPDAEINFHAASLTARDAEVKADFTDNRRRAVKIFPSAPMNSATEKQILAALTQLDETVKTIATANPKPSLLPMFARIDELTAQLPRATDPTLLHYLHKKSYEKARLYLQGCDAENQAGNCRHV